MRKLLLVFFVILSVHFSVSAQDEESGGAGPEFGDILIEITASPFDRDGNGDALLSFGQFRARYWLSDLLVPRLGLWYDYSSEASTPDDVFNSASWMVNPGVEFHFVNNGAFTSYAAADILISGEWRQLESTTDSNVDGSLQRPSGTNYSFSDASRGSFSIGLGASAGADYHFSSRFYIGAEVGFYILGGQTSDVEVDGELFQEGTMFWNGGVTTMNAVRIGFKLL